MDKLQPNNRVAADYLESLVVMQQSVVAAEHDRYVSR